jgi:hypothetical protein
MGLREICEGGDWTDVTQDWVQWLKLVKRIMNLQVS